MGLKRARIKICLICILLLLACVCQRVTSQRKPKQATQPHVSKEQWHKLTDPSNDFAVFFPIQPNLRTADRNNRLIEEYTVSYDGCLFSFEYFKIDKKTADGYGRMRNYLQDQTIRTNIQDGWRLLGQKLLPGNGYETNWAVPSNGTMAYMRRQEFFRNSRAYAIGFHSYDYEDLNGRLAKRFFSSLRFKGMDAMAPSKTEK